MNDEDFEYHLNHLKNLNPDQLVADLELTTEEILDAFSATAEVFIYKEFG